MCAEVKHVVNNIATLPARYGKYELLERIGVGGMAEVYRARLPGFAGFEKDVVIKRLRPKHARDDTLIRLFIEEAKLAAQVNHKNIVQVYELGRLNSGELFIAMEYIHGTDLRRLTDQSVKTALRIPIWLAIHIIVEVLEALTYAHDCTDESGRPRNLVHCDVTPENIFISRLGDIKLGDFGVANDDTRVDAPLADQTKGKLPYMSPEQVLEQPVDGRTDVFSASVVLWETIAGRRLFPGRTPSEVMAQICASPRPPLSKYNKSVPAVLDNVIMRALDPDIQTRFQSAQHLASELKSVLEVVRPRLEIKDVSAALVHIMDAPIIYPNASTLDIEEDDDGHEELEALDRAHDSHPPLPITRPDSPPTHRMFSAPEPRRLNSSELSSRPASSNDDVTYQLIRTTPPIDRLQQPESSQVPYHRPANHSGPAQIVSDQMPGTVTSHPTSAPHPFITRAGYYGDAHPRKSWIANDSGQFNSSPHDRHDTLTTPDSTIDRPKRPEDIEVIMQEYIAQEEPRSHSPSVLGGALPLWAKSPDERILGPFRPHELLELLQRTERRSHPSFHISIDRQRWLTPSRLALLLGERLIARDIPQLSQTQRGSLTKHSFIEVTGSLALKRWSGVLSIWSQLGQERERLEIHLHLGDLTHISWTGAPFETWRILFDNAQLGALGLPEAFSQSIVTQTSVTTHLPSAANQHIMVSRNTQARKRFENALTWTQGEFCYTPNSEETIGANHARSLLRVLPSVTYCALSIEDIERRMRSRLSQPHRLTDNFLKRHQELGLTEQEAVILSRLGNNLPLGMAVQKLQGQTDPKFIWVMAYILSEIGLLSIG